MPRKSNTADRRAEIVAATLKVLAANGYERTTIQEIAKQANLTAGLIHYHFEDKREILIALAKHLSDYVYQRYLQFAADASTPETRLRAYLQARLGFGAGASPDAVAAWVVIGSEAIRDTAVGEVYQEAIAFELKLVRELLAAYCADRRRSQANVARLAAVLMAFIEGAFQLSSAARKVMPRGYAAEAAFLLVDRFLKAEPASNM
jgi:TetR/AcrR family transcriptional regulator, transcriptional repressor of bet genes